MTPFGYLFVTAAILIARQVIVGRVSEMGGDLRDLIVSLLRGDIDSAGEVAKRRGENVPEGLGTGSSGTSADFAPFLNPNFGSTDFTRHVIELGDAAKGYQSGAEGPNYYDCSGLIYRALVDLKLWNGARFTTSTFSRSVGPKIAKEVVPSPGVPSVIRPGDILVWDGHHMGVAIGNGDYYSAKNVHSGIKASTIAGDISYFGYTPRVWRLNK